MATYSQPRKNWFEGTMRRVALQGLVIIAAVAWIYYPILHGGWLWDDTGDITQNLVTRDPNGLWKIWFQPGCQIDYYPVKASVQWLQWHLWAYNTLGYHLTNIMLHGISAFLVWRLFAKLGLRVAWLGGLLFAIHPTMVESVAWIAELKNTLSLPPFLLALCFYLDYDEHQLKRYYFLALGFFLVAMLCKPTMVMFPVVILLYAWWKQNRIARKDLIASLPFFAVAMILGWVTLEVGTWYQQRYFLSPGVDAPESFLSRIALTGLSISFYFSKVILPVELAPIYPYWKVSPPTLIQFLPWPVALGAIYWLWTKRNSWGRHALLGLGFFLILLAPFVTINMGSFTAFTWVMDHFLYIPIIGLIGLAVAGLGQVNEMVSSPYRLCGVGILTGGLALLAWGSHAYAALYLNQEALWTYGLQRNPDAWVAHNGLGTALLDKGQMQKALGHFDEALRLNPDYLEAHLNRGSALARLGRFPEAIAEFKQVLQANAGFTEAQNNLGLAFLQMGQTSQAIALFQQILRQNPNDAQAQCNWGHALVQIGYPDGAIQHFKEAIRLDPQAAETYYNWGTTLLYEGQSLEAIERLQEAIRINPDYAAAHCNLGTALAKLGRQPEAIAEFQKTLRLDPDNSEAKNNLLSLQQSGAVMNN